VSKYALSRGIIEVTGSVSGGYLYSDAEEIWVTFKIGRDAYETEAEAKAAAEEMRLKKIKALRKQAATLEKLQFLP
jgi:hypothetical protein